MTNPENQNLPKAQVGIMSGSGSAFSSKQKIFGGLASLVALVAVGFGGLSVWQGTSSNAAGEESLGRDVSVNLVATELPYFKILRASQRQVLFQPQGEAKSSDSQGFADGWRVEKSFTPDISDSWVVAAEAGGASATGDTWFVPDRDSVTIAQGSETNFASPSSIQPNTDYYYRIAKMVEANAIGDDGETYDRWEAQGPVMHVKTSPDPQITISKIDGVQITAAWKGGTDSWGADAISDLDGDPSDLYGKSNGSYYTIFKSTVPIKKFAKVDVYQFGVSISGDSSVTQDQQKVDGYLKAGQTLFTQPIGSTHYYGIALNGYALADTGVQATAGTKEGTGISTVSISGATMLANALSTKTVTIKVTTPPAQNNAWARISVLKGAVTAESQTGSSYFTGDICWKDVGGLTVNTPVTTSMSNATTATSSGAQYCYPYPGKYTLGVKTNSMFGTQTNVFPITLSKLDSRITASYADSTIKYGKAAKVRVALPLTTFYGRPAGTIKLKNLNTGKILKTISTTSSSSTPQVFTLSGIKPGKYRLAVIYTAGRQYSPDAGSVTFNSKTINLPVLKVSK
jgi:hypothetical protein